MLGNRDGWDCWSSQECNSCTRINYQTPMYNRFNHGSFWKEGEGNILTQTAYKNWELSRNSVMGIRECATIQNCRRLWLPVVDKNRAAWVLYPISVNSVTQHQARFCANTQTNCKDAAGMLMTAWTTPKTHPGPIELWGQSQFCDGCLDVSESQSFHCCIRPLCARRTTLQLGPWCCRSGEVPQWNQSCWGICQYTARFWHIRQGMCDIIIVWIKIDTHKDSECYMC